MTKLDHLINSLNTDKYAAVTIRNTNGGQVIYKDLLSENVLNQFQSAENLFAQLLTDGYTHVSIEPRRKNGNTFKSVDEVFNISPQAAVQPLMVSEPIQNLSVATPVENQNFAIKKKKKKKKKKNGLFGLNGGLTGAELIALNVRADKVSDLQERNRKLEDDNARLSEKNSELKEEQLLKKYTAENSDSRNNLFAVALQNAPMLLGAFGVKTTPTGLAAPDAILSDVQTKILNIVKSTAEPVNEILLKVLYRLQSTDENDTFKALFMKFLNENEII